MAGARVEICSIGLTIIAALFLRLIHRRVRTLQQRLDLGTVAGIKGDADAGRDLQLLAVNHEGHAQGLQYFVGAQDGILRVRHFRQQDHEFVAAEPADRVRRSHATGQSLRDRLQQPVAGEVAQANR